MKKQILFTLFVLFALSSNAAPFKFLPYTVTQPDGSVINCYASGDEFFNWIHDRQGYSIIKGGDGYYYYAEKANGKIIASKYRVNSIKAESTGLQKWIKISREEYLEKRKGREVPNRDKSTKSTHAGTINNIVIYIRFAGESEIATERQVYDNALNLYPGESLKTYYKEVSYNHLTINSTHYPACDNPATTNASYQDFHTRGYFQPYNASTNPSGYVNDYAAMLREHKLLVDAVTWVNTNNPIPASLNIDSDNDGYVDNVCFMINGNCGEWAELLWAHRWVLYSYTVKINGKTVWDYTFQPENQVSVGTLCHEMFHSLGAPDLYHYDDGGLNLSPAGSWDIMDGGDCHMGAYMKWKYGGSSWISSIPVISSSGTYTLNPLTTSTSNCYKIASPNSSSEFFIVEYRKKSGYFESKIPGNGLIVYRINSDYTGNADFDNYSTFDEVYVYRPGGSPTINGSVNSANFSVDTRRTAINDDTDPGCFLHDGSEGGLSISSVTSAEDTISFTVTFTTIENPDTFACSVSDSQINLSWNLNGNSNNVMVAWSASGIFGTPVNGTGYSAGNSIGSEDTVLYIGPNEALSHTSLTPSSYYHYKIWSVDGSNNYSPGIPTIGNTQCGTVNMPLTEDFSERAKPVCWQVTDNAFTGDVWSFNNPGCRIFTSTTSTNGFAILDSDDYGYSSNQNSGLVTPLLNLSAFNIVNIKFEHYFRQYQYSLASFYYSTDGGSSWTELATWSSSEGSKLIPAFYDTDVTAQVAGQSDVMFKWEYTGSYEWYWCIDDIEITGAITGEVFLNTKSATNITTDSVTLNGMINANSNSVTNIEFEYGTETGNYTSSVEGSPSSASGTSNTAISANLTGLSPGTQYFYRIKCNVDVTEYVGSERSFTTSSITTGSVSGGPHTIGLTEGTVINVPFTATGPFTSNTFTAYLSDKDGNFSSEIAIASWGSNFEGSMTATIPANTPAGTGYKIRVKSSSPAITGSESNAFETSLDNVRPTATISSTESDPTSNSPFTIQITFSENVTGLNLSDIIVGNGVAENLTATSYTVYTAEITPTTGGDVTVEIPEDAARDVAANGNTSTAQWSITYTGTGVEEINNEEISVSPNPSNGFFNLSFSKKYELVNIKVFDLSGSLLYSVKHTGSNNYYLDLSTYSKGMYFLQIIAENKILNTPLIIQ